jgi:16S rRNA (uracil1498-N3)-methyltransferase
MQSRRVHLPEVVVADFAAVAQMAAVALAEPDADDRIGPSVSAVAVGPEGGFAPGELAQVERRVRLTDTILRVETAAIAAGAALVAAHT